MKIHIGKLLVNLCNLTLLFTLLCGLLSLHNIRTVLAKYDFIEINVFNHSKSISGSPYLKYIISLVSAINSYFDIFQFPCIHLCLFLSLITISGVS